LIYVIEEPYMSDRKVHFRLMEEWCCVRNC